MSHRPAAADTAPKRIHFVSLGCPKNRVDTEVMLGVAKAAGCDLAVEAEDADYIVVNTCGFIGPAKEESIDTILAMGRLKEEGKLRGSSSPGASRSATPTSSRGRCPRSITSSGRATCSSSATSSTAAASA
jgi:hypothetical protein